MESMVSRRIRVKQKRHRLTGPLLPFIRRRMLREGSRLRGVVDNAQTSRVGSQGRFILGAVSLRIG
jgi:hypothetical protein